MALSESGALAEPNPIIAILRGITASEVKPVCDALVASGIGRIEVPLNVPDAIRLIAHAVEVVGDRAVIGAGTALTREHVRAVAALGARFVLSPDIHEAVVEEALSLDLEVYPGVFTPTEALRGVRSGATGLKLFPAQILGAGGVRALRAVLPADLPLYVSGGVAPESLAGFIEARSMARAVPSLFDAVPANDATQVGTYG